jgi:hypothetical protein
LDELGLSGFEFGEGFFGFVALEVDFFLLTVKQVVGFFLLFVGTI